MFCTSLQNFPSSPARGRLQSDTWEVRADAGEGRFGQRCVWLIRCLSSIGKVRIDCMGAVAVLADTWEHKWRQMSETLQINFWLPVECSSSAWMGHRCLLHLHSYGCERPCKYCQWHYSLLSASQISNPKLQSRHGSCLAESPKRTFWLCLLLSVLEEKLMRLHHKNATIGPSSVLPFKIP